MNLPRPPWLKNAGISKTAAQTVNALKTKVAQMSAQIQQMQDLLDELDLTQISKAQTEQQKVMETITPVPQKKSKSQYRPEKIADITERRLRNRK